MMLNRILNRRLGIAAATLTLATAATAQAAPQWLTPQIVSQPGEDASNQQVAFDEGGDAVAVWRATGPQMVIMASARPAGGLFSSPQTLSDPSAYSTSPDIASDAQGDSIAVWLHFDGSNARVQASYRPAGGTFGAPQTVSPAGYEAKDPRVAMDASGEAMLVWSLVSGFTEKLQTSSAASGGVFGGPVDLTAFTPVQIVPQVALDSHGNALVVWDGWDGSNIRIQAAQRPAGSSFGSPRYLSQAGENADTPQVAFDSAGNALAVWRFDGSPASTIQADYRPVEGEFDTPQTVSAPSSQPAQVPQVAFDGQGEGVVAWQQSDGSELRVDASVRALGSTGTFSPQSTLDPGGQEAYEPRIAGDGLSATIVSWKTFNGANYTAQAAVRASGASFTPATTISAVGPQEGVPEVGIDAQGNGIAVFSRSNGPNYLLEAAGYDGAGPLLRGLTLPTRGVVGQPLQFFLAPLDVWNPVLSEGFSFGDGSSAIGVSATHTYDAPGSYQVSATATDVLGNTTTVTRTLTIGTPTPVGPIPSAIRCALSTARTQKLLRKGIVTAGATCNATLLAAFSGHLTVRVPLPHHGKHPARTALYSYTLTPSRATLGAGALANVQLVLPRAALHVVLSALSKHRQVELYLALTSTNGTHADTHVANIALARRTYRGH